jgi:hypothetical protein
MKKKLVIGIAVLTVTVLTVSAVLAQAGPSGSGYWASANVQRIGNSAGSATVVMTGYAKEGSTGEYNCGTRTLASFGDGATFYPHWASDPAGDNCANDGSFPGSFEGSVILSSNDEIAAIVQVLNIGYGGWAPGDTPYGRAVGAYAGVSAPDTTVRFPLYKNDHNNEMTTFYVQNASSSAVDITAVFVPCADQGSGTPCLGRATGPYTYTYSGLDANRMIVIDATLAENASSASMPAGNGSYGSLVVTGTGNIAGAVMEHSQDASPATYIKAVAGFSPSQYDDKYFAPQVKSQYPVAASTNGCASKWSSLMVQNADTGSVTVDVVYTVNENPVNGARVGEVFTDTKSIDPGETAFFMTFQQTDFAVGDLASAEVKATGDVVAMINEETRWECTNADLKDQASWAAIPDSAAKTSISVPFYKEDYNGKFQGLVVQNVGTSNATFTLTLTVIGSQITGVDTGDVYQFTHTDAKGAGAAKTFVMPCDDITPNLTQIGTADYHDLCDVAGSRGTNVAVIVESPQPIVGVVAEEKGWWEAASSVGDGHSEDASMYTAIPLD